LVGVGCRMMVIGPRVGTLVGRLMAECHGWLSTTTTVPDVKTG